MEITLVLNLVENWHRCPKTLGQTKAQTKVAYTIDNKTTRTKVIIGAEKPSVVKIKKSKS